MRWGPGSTRLRAWLLAASLVALVPWVVAAPASAQEPAGDDGSDPIGYTDGGEGSSAAIAEALRDGTPEELAQRRAEVVDRLEAAGSAEAFITALESEAVRVLDELDAGLAAAQQDLADAHAAEAQAEAELDAAVEASEAAEQRARSAASALRDATVDMFINPPQADSVRAALSGTVEEEMASTGLLVGRAEVRRSVSERRDRALVAAGRAERAAERASERAEAAAGEVQAAAAEIDEQLRARSLELIRIRQDLQAARSEVADLQLTDSVLATRLALDSLGSTGSVTAQRDDTGNWVPDVSGLPSRTDMVRIGDTNVWVHRLVAPNVLAMFLAALEDGVVLAGSAHRDSLRQIELRASHCGSSYEAIFTAPSSSCSPPTARPGQSMHERGLAIDFTEGGSVLTRSSASFRWLAQNASDFGFFNLPSEPWHWSVNGR